MGVRLLSLERKWEMEGKTPLQKARLRYYYRNRTRILSNYKTTKGERIVWDIPSERKNTAIELV